MDRSSVTEGASQADSEITGRRVLRIAGTRNLRDLGGIPLESGGAVKPGRLLRAEAFGELPEAGLDRIREIGVRTILDLREHTERRREGEAFAPEGVGRAFVPLLAGGVNYGEVGGLGDLYVKMIDACGARLAEIGHLLQLEGTLPAVIHCSAGKDRTGVVSAVILSALGVPDEQVIGDYVLTGEALTPSWRSILTARSLASGWPEHKVNEMLASPPEAMEQMLVHLRQAHGGAARYLIDSGLDPNDFDRLTHLLVAT